MLLLELIPNLNTNDLVAGMITTGGSVFDQFKPFIFIFVGVFIGTLIISSLIKMILAKRGIKTENYDPDDYDDDDDDE